MRYLPAIAASGLVLLAIGFGLGPVLAIGLGGDGGLAFDSYLWRVLRFTLLQATFSTLLSVGLAIPLSWALFRSEFPGRRLLLSVFALPMALPVIVAILGIVAIFGQNGLVARVTGLAPDIYGLTGILLAHVFFNLPLATRLLVQALENVAPEPWRLSAQLGFTARDRFRLIGWPAMRGSVVSAASLIFLLCVASFAAVLTLGGGPKATTLEVAIYQALRFDFDPARAGALSLVQLAICMVFVVFALRFVKDLNAGTSLRSRRYGLQPQRPRFIETAMIVAAGILVVSPLLAILVSGLLAPFAWSAIGRASLTSLAIASLATTASIMLALPLAFAMARSSSRVGQSALSIIGILGLLIPPAVLATGWFIVASRIGLSWWLALFLVSAMNCLMALPFTLRAIAPALRDVLLPQDRLCASLGIGGLTRLRLIDLPLLAGPLGFAAAIGFTVSLGDLTAIALLGSQDLITLPSLIYSQMGRYQINAASATALVLLAGSLLVTLLASRLGQRA